VLITYNAEIRKVLLMVMDMQGDYWYTPETGPSIVGTNMTFVLRLVFLLWFAYLRYWNS